MTMQISTVFAFRKSVRTYTSEEIPPAVIEQLLTWASYAPSAGALYPLSYIIIQRGQQREATVAATFCGTQLDQPQKWILAAPLLLAICGDLKRVKEKYGGTGLDLLSMLSQDCGAAVENILLGAVSIGLGGCYITGFRQDALSTALWLPQHIVPLALVALGHGTVAPQSRKPRPVTVYENWYGNRWNAQGAEKAPDQ